MLIPRSDWNYTGSVQVSDVVCVNASTFVTVSSDSALTQFTYDPIAIVNIGTLSFSTPAGVALVGNGSAIVSYQSNSQYDLFYLPTMGRTGITTGATAAYIPSFNFHPTIIGNASGYACSTSTTASKYAIINCNAASSVQFSCPVTNASVYAVANKGSNFLLATGPNSFTTLVNTGIFEVNTAGTILNSFQYPYNPLNALGTTPQTAFTSVRWAPPYVVATTNNGTVCVINWAASSLSAEYNTSAQTAGQSGTSTLTEFASGVGLIIQQGQTTALQCGYQELYVGTTSASGGICIGETTYFENNVTPITAGSFEPVNGRYCLITANTVGQGFRLRVADTNPMNQVGVPTRIQQPAGLDITTGSVFRIRDRGIGKSIIDLDQLVGAGPTMLPAAQGSNYIELGLNGLTGTNEAWDIRYFTA